MLNIGIITDISWNNFILVENKFKKLNNDEYRLHVLYGKNLELLSNCAIKNNLSLIRNTNKNLSEILSQLLSICDIWLLFTNCVEYSIPYNIMLTCNIYNIKYIIISEHSRTDNYYSFLKDSNESFKKTIKKLTVCQNKCEHKFDVDYLKPNLIYTMPTLDISIRDKIKRTYTSIEQNKKDKSIKLLYDKSQLKNDKQEKKLLKAAKIMEYNHARLNYYNSNNIQNL